MITGASGCIGYELYKYFSKNRDYRVITTARSEIPESVEHVVFDFLTEDFDAVFSMFRPDIIFHCAAMIPDKNVADSIVAVTNREIDDKIITYCLKDIETKLIYFSTVSFYKLEDKIVNTEESMSDERLNKYFSEKLFSEHLIKSNCKNYIIFRVSSPYSILQRHNNVLKLFVENAFFRQKVTYFGSGKRTQDFIHVSDVALAAERSIICRDSDVFNIASGVPISMYDLAYLIANVAHEVCGISVDICSSGMDDPQALHRANISIEKAKKILGWQPRANLREELKIWFRYLSQKR